MKKFIGFLGAIGLIATTTGSVVSCGAKDATTTGTYQTYLKNTIPQIKMLKH
jgi:hypothetical protein